MPMGHHRAKWSVARRTQAMFTTSPVFFRYSDSRRDSGESRKIVLFCLPTRHKTQWQELTIHDTSWRFRGMPGLPTWRKEHGMDLVSNTSRSSRRSWSPLSVHRPHAKTWSVGMMADRVQRRVSDRWALRRLAAAPLHHLRLSISSALRWEPRAVSQSSGRPSWLMRIVRPLTDSRSWSSQRDQALPASIPRLLVAFKCFFFSIKYAVRLMGADIRSCYF